LGITAFGDSYKLGYPQANKMIEKTGIPIFPAKIQKNETKKQMAKKNKCNYEN
jgi:hypothetical protein